MTVSELRALLARHDITPLKSRGQHFLLDESVVRDMAEAAAIKAGDNVLEIGPGPGILTLELLRRGARLTAVELDMKMCALLRERFKNENFNLINANILETPDNLTSFQPYNIVSNLPYNITSEVLTKFLTEQPKPVTMTVMIQREVAERILAKPGEMNSLAVLVQTFGEVKKICRVPAGAFFPPPKVESAVIHIRVKTESEIGAFFGSVKSDDYFAVVRSGFVAKRRQLKNSLNQLFLQRGKDPIAVFRAAEVRPSARPEELDLSAWKRLAAALTN